MGIEMMNFDRIVLVFVVLICVGMGVGCGQVIPPVKPCQTTGDCLASQQCLKGSCQQSGTTTCQTRSDCKGNQECVQQVCQVQPSKEPVQRPDGGSTEPPSPSEPPSSVDGGPTDTPVMPPERRQNPPEGPTDTDPLPKPSASVYSPVTGCQPNTSRRCALRFGTDGNNACKVGTQSCLFDQTWGECLWTKPYETSSDWVTPDQRESCNERDDNCDGQIDEGCNRGSLWRCAPQVRVTFGMPVTEKIYQGAGTPDQVKDIFLHYDNANKRLVLSRAKDVGDPAGPRVMPLLSLPPHSNQRPAFDLSPDKQKIAIATKDRLIIWMLAYDASAQPSLKGYINVQVTNISGVWFRGVDGHLLVMQNRYFNKKYEYYLSRWKLDTDRATLSMEKRVKLEPSSPESYFPSTRPIDPSGRWFALHSYRELSVYALPSLERKGFKTLEFPPDPEERWLAFHPTKPWLVIAPYAYRKVLTIDLTPDAQGSLALKELDIYRLDKENKAYGFGFQKLSFDPQTGDLIGSQGTRQVRWSTPADGQNSLPLFDKANGSVFAIDHKHQWAFIGDTRGTISIWSLSSYKRVYQWQVFPTSWNQSNLLRALQLLPNGTTMLVRKLDEVELWDVTRDAMGNWSAKQKQVIHSKIDSTKRYKTNPVAISHDSMYIAQAIGQDILIFKRNTQDGTYTLQKTLQDSRTDYNTLTFHPSQPWLIATNTGKEVRVWSMDGAFVTRVVETFTDKPLQAVWYVENGQSYILMVVHVNGGRVLGKTWDVGANGAVVSKDLEKFASLNAPSSFEDIQFDTKQRRIFYRTKYLSGSDDTMFFTNFFISPPKADGSRELSTSGVKRSVPDLIGAKWMKADWPNNRVYAFTANSLHIWACRLP